MSQLVTLVLESIKENDLEGIACLELICGLPTFSG
jgi:hypothetical protein